MAEQENEQQLRDEFESALGAEARAEAKIDPCAIYRLVPKSLKDALGRWIERRFGAAAKLFYDALIQIADKYCKVG